MLVKQVLEKEVELVSGELRGSKELGLKIGFKDSESTVESFLASTYTGGRGRQERRS